MISTSSEDVWILYLNHRGETAWRRVRPWNIIFTTEPPWHLEKQWLMRAFDYGRGGLRTFAMTNIQGWSATKPSTDEGTRTHQEKAE